MRKIVHVDMDAFYASVEQRERPELRGRPVIVGGSPESRGVVCSASYEARKFGVRSAIPSSRARRLCPDGVFLSPDFELYRAVSRELREIFKRHTPLVEPLSLDEAYLDVTEELTGLRSGTETAAVIREEIRSELKLTASAGIAPNKFLAKLASDWRKPDGQFVIKPHQVDDFLTPLPVGKIPGVGKATEKVLHYQGIVAVADLRRAGPVTLTALLGSYGERLYELSQGIDERPVEPDRPVKSISNENTFETDLILEEVASYIMKSAADLWASASLKHRIGRTVTVKLRAADFVTATRRTTVALPPSSAEELAEIARHLLGQFSFSPDSRFRLAGVGLSNFSDEDPLPSQHPLF